MNKKSTRCNSHQELIQHRGSPVLEAGTENGAGRERGNCARSREGSKLKWSLEGRAGVCQAEKRDPADTGDRQQGESRKECPGTAGLEVSDLSHLHS